MANKVKNIRALSIETAREITQTPENWMQFLDTASRIYKYPFHEQMLIYAQRPDAIACAPIEVWNKNLHRWVNRGSKGIVLLDDSGSYLKLKYTQISPGSHPYCPNFRKPKKKYPSTLPLFSLRHVQNRFYKQNWRQIWQNIIILRKRAQ